MTDLGALEPAVAERSGGRCELCEGTDGLAVVEVGPSADPTPDRALHACGRCAAGLGGELGDDPGHWFCLQGSAWSEVPVVQVASWRLLGAVGATWATDLRDQIYLDEDTLQWARSGQRTHEAVVTVDSNGTPLADGDAVTLIKDLDVKGANFTAKRGTMVKGIRLTDDPGLVEGRVNKTSIFLKTEFLKRA